MVFFVKQDSIVRRIWEKADTILFIFAGASSEFALNKAVDWLYFTGRLPSDPLGRLFTTVAYARQIVFSEKGKALRFIDQMTKIHNKVEDIRGQSIPDWAYRDVLFMLIDYSIRSYELLERKLSMQEKEEVFNVFNRVGERMRIKELPVNYEAWKEARTIHMENNLEKSAYTLDLFLQYKKHLGIIRYKILLEAQLLVLPAKVSGLMGWKKYSFLKPAVPFYKLAVKMHMEGYIKSLILPGKYKRQISEMDKV